jgi:2-polyprenyl-3-methyl-5-hydroxy-6-metoxy-1,4-benzoquinol methylase
MNDDYDEIYRRADVFGSGASPLLAQCSEFLPTGGSVLDIGIGQGRNALPLVRAGCRVTGIDPSEVAIQTVQRLAAAHSLTLDLVHTAFEDYRPDQLFDTILCFGLLQIQNPTGAEALLDRCGRWLKPGGTLFLTAWHMEDPSYLRIRGEWEKVAPQFFRSPEVVPSYRFFLSPGQILEYFPDWLIRHHQEGLGPWHNHGDGPQERHGDVNLVATKPPANT